MSDFTWPEGAREISGFGGGYEAACRAMVSAGAKWLEENPKADPLFHGFEGVYGIIQEDNEDAKSLTKAVISAANGDATGAMHQAAISHVLFIKKNGWPEYMVKMQESTQ